MQTTQYIVTAWFRASDDVPGLFEQLAEAAGQDPFETTEMEGVRDMQWSAATTNDALAIADRLKPYCDNPALILLKVTTYYAGGSVDAVTIKDERAALRLPQPAKPATASDPYRADTLADRQEIVRRIEQAGYRLHGWHDAIDDRDGGPVIVEATHRSTGQTHRVEVQTRGPAGEAQALEELARRLGLSNE